MAYRYEVVVADRIKPIAMWHIDVEEEACDHRTKGVQGGTDAYRLSEVELFVKADDGQLFTKPGVQMRLARTDVYRSTYTNWPFRLGRTLSGSLGSASADTTVRANAWSVSGVTYGVE